MAPFILPSDPPLGPEPAEREGFRWSSISAAGALHLLVLLLLVLLSFWGLLGNPPVPAEKPPIPVKIVYEKPPQPKPAPTPQQQQQQQQAAKPPPPPAPAQQAPDNYTRMSGPDQQTTSPPSGQPAANVETPPDDAAATTPAPPPPDAGKEKAGHSSVALLTVPPSVMAPAKQKPDRAPHRPDNDPGPTLKPSDPRLKGAAPGEREMRGDPYINAIAREIRTRFVYPQQAAALGLTGSGEFVLIIDRSGQLLQIEVMKSTGSTLLDRAALDALHAAHFPPVPPSFSGTPLELTWTPRITPE